MISVDNTHWLAIKDTAASTASALDTIFQLLLSGGGRLVIVADMFRAVEMSSLGDQYMANNADTGGAMNSGGGVISSDGSTSGSGATSSSSMTGSSGVTSSSGMTSDSGVTISGSGTSSDGAMNSGGSTSSSSMMSSSGGVISSGFETSGGVGMSNDGDSGGSGKTSLVLKWKATDWQSSGNTGCVLKNVSR